jgi:hypothetical protein
MLSVAEYNEAQREYEKLDSSEREAWIKARRKEKLVRTKVSPEYSISLPLSTPASDSMHSQWLRGLENKPGDVGKSWMSFVGSAARSKCFHI